MHIPSPSIDLSRIPSHLPFETIEKELLRLIELPAIASGLLMLCDLPTFLFYHNANHTKSVLWMTVALSLAERVSVHEREILAVAAVFHDLGFLGASLGRTEDLYENENKGAQISMTVMSRYSYSEAEIDTVREMILDTALIPAWDGASYEQGILRTPLSAYLLDADLHNLGTNDFLPNVLRLFNEQFGVRIESLQDLRSHVKGYGFLKDSYSFISRHTWKTECAKHLLEEKERANAEELQCLIRELGKV